jgi:hypothetical protein
MGAMLPSASLVAVDISDHFSPLANATHYEKAKHRQTEDELRRRTAETNPRSATANRKREPRRPCLFRFAGLDAGTTRERRAIDPANASILSHHSPRNVHANITRANSTKMRAKPLPTPRSAWSRRSTLGLKLRQSDG